MTLPSNLVLTLQPDGSMAFVAAPAAGGAVGSVNTKTGDVSLDAADVGADPAGVAAAAQVAAQSYTDSKISGLAPVATSGSYNDLTDKPTAPVGSGAVDSVNGQTGTVTLTATDLGALSQSDADARYVAKANAIDLPSVEAAVAAMLTGGKSTGITFVYDQANEHINATVTPGITSSSVTSVVTLTAAAYAALGTKNAATLYVVTP